jgi:hypothetical protein
MKRLSKFPFFGQYEEVSDSERYFIEESFMDGH